MERPRGFLAVWCGCFMSEASFLQVVFYRTESRILPAKVPIEGLYLIKFRIYPVKVPIESQVLYSV